MNAVASPSHYVQGHIEAIYAIEQVLGVEGFKAFCMGNYLKYKMRHEHKNGKEDLDKAQTYLDWAVNGLPAPVNNRVPKKQSPRDLGSVSALLQVKLDNQTKGGWKVVSTTAYGIYDNISHGRFIFRVIDPNGLGFNAVLNNVHGGALYASIVQDAIAEIKSKYPSEFIA